MKVGTMVRVLVIGLWGPIIMANVVFWPDPFWVCVVVPTVPLTLYFWKEGGRVNREYFP